MAKSDPNHRFVRQTSGSVFWYERYYRSNPNAPWSKDDDPVEVSDKYDVADLKGAPADFDPASPFGVIAIYGGGKLLEDRESDAKPSEKIARRNARWAAFLRGEMKKPRETGPRAPADLVAALMDVMSISLESAKATLVSDQYIDAWDELRANEDIAASIKRQKEATVIDLGSFLPPADADADAE